MEQFNKETKVKFVYLFVVLINTICRSIIETFFILLYHTSTGSKNVSEHILRETDRCLRPEYLLVGRRFLLFIVGTELLLFSKYFGVSLFEYELELVEHRLCVNFGGVYDRCLAQILDEVLLGHVQLPNLYPSRHLQRQFVLKRDRRLLFQLESGRRLKNFGG